ncbi:MAG: reverse transcriptase domain-containing protein [Candidatus Hinthialibacter sp.]
MKRFKNLYPAVFEFQNLLKAARQAQRGKRFRPDVAQFNLNLERELLSLQQELKEKSYRHGGYRHFPIHEGKKRIISSAPYRDRVVHHALCNVIEPLIDRTFIHDSYACRKGKGTHAAVDRLTQFIRKNQYALKIDIRKYFPNIRHEILREIIQRKIGDIWILPWRNVTLSLPGIFRKVAGIFVSLVK